ncbi:MAG: DUF6439 family protein [Oculatellaceae cyanobacterium Prado106]|nr:DUF6439 family protein [Oculatellaceae cyanobacterium Prado106]
MADTTQVTPTSSAKFPASVPFVPNRTESATPLAEVSTVELAQALAARLAIGSSDWHALKANRKARAQELVASALVYLLKDNSEESLARLQQSVGWLDRSISAPPCEHHGSGHKH